MIDKADTFGHSGVRHRKRDWAYVFAGLAVLLPSFGFYMNSRRAEAPQLEYEIPRAEPLKPRGFLGSQANSLVVRVFDPVSGEWRESTKKDVVPGEEFVAMSILFKEYIYGWMSELHREIDVTRLENASRGFDASNDRRPTADDVVYVFGQDLPRTGFQWLPTVGPGETFRFRGRVYETAEGSSPTMLRIIDTGKTLPRAGGDPDPKPLNLILSKQTQDRFPATTTRQPRTSDQEGAENGDSIE